MRLAATCILILMGVLCLYSRVIEYKTFIYTSEELADDIREANEINESNRALGLDLLNSTVGALNGIGAGYITSFANIGVNYIGNLITRNARLEQEWENMVAEENKWSGKICSLHDVRDFYSKPSTAGALDPMDMNFDGIGCLRMEGSDTAFFVSFHVDRNKLNRIVNHSKFELVLDTLVISPIHSNLPNTSLPLSFSFKERSNYIFEMGIKITSSWFTDAIELHSDAPLGEFKITIPVAESDLDSTGFLRYVRTEDGEAKYTVIGESFIVPRSYMGYRDSQGRFKNIWGTGQYKLEVSLEEYCNVTPEYRNSWKEDRKRRKNMATKNDGVFSGVWQTISSQHWDEITKSWVITTLSAPAGILSNEIITKMGAQQNAQSPNR